MSRAIKPDRRDAVGQLLLIADAERHWVLCGRRLRGDQSVARQYGPRCWRKRNREEAPVFSGQPTALSTNP